LTAFGQIVCEAGLLFFKEYVHFVYFVYFVALVEGIAVEYGGQTLNPAMIFFLDVDKLLADSVSLSSLALHRWSDGTEKSLAILDSRIMELRGCIAFPMDEKESQTALFPASLAKLSMKLP